MFEEQYRKMNQSIEPSPALNDETVALMKEAQDHRAAPIPAPLRWRPALVLPIAGTMVAMVIATILLALWVRQQPYVEPDALGVLDEVYINDSTDENTAPPEETPPEEQEPENGTLPPEEEPEQEDAAPPPAEEPGDDSESSEPDPEEPTLDNKDPRDPDIINDEETVTYLSIGEFLTDLAAKKTVGYGKNYYNARELILVPSKLPDQSRFRHFHLNTETGKYAYSYLFTAEGKEYFLDIEVDAKAPKTLRDLNLQKDTAREETIQSGEKGNQLFYLFGKEDYITVTVTEVNSTIALTEEQVKLLLAQFELERCSLTNELIHLSYGE